MLVRSAGSFVTSQELEALGRANLLAQDEEENYMLQLKLPVAERIECRLYPKVTFFFDGTGNNLHQELEKPKDEQALTNVAKLFQMASWERVLDGATPVYIPGVGTPFRITNRKMGYTDFPDDPGGPLGLGMGMGGDMRIRYAMGEFARIMDLDWKPENWRDIKYVTLSVFGFSRGATQARAFVRRLLKERCMHTDSGLVWKARGSLTIPLRIRFMGLFDTVASVGGPGLHLSYGSELAIPGEVERCVHFVAAHEVRKAFPLDSLRVGLNYPDNCEEVVYPGTHSDVGGGYAPGEQGRSNDFSKIPLRHMYLEALKAGVPLHGPDRVDEQFAGDITLDATAPVVTAYHDYMAALGTGGSDVESLILEHRKLHFHWRAALTRDNQENRILGTLLPKVDPTFCAAVPPATDLDHPACDPTKWDYHMPRDPKKQAAQLLREHRRLVEQVAFLRHPVALRDKNNQPLSYRKRLPYEDLILAAWDNPAKPSPAVDTLLAEHLHDSVAHFTQFPCTLFDPRKIYCDSEKYYANTRPSSPATYQDAVV